MVLVAIALIGLGIHLAAYPFELEVVIAIVLTALVLSVCLRVAQIWEATVVLTSHRFLGTTVLLGVNHEP